MTKSASIFDGTKYIYAEMLGGKEPTFTIKAVRPIEITGDKGRKDQGFEMAFAETDKQFVFSTMAIRRFLAGAFGLDYAAYVGKKVTLYAVPSTRSPSGQAIRLKLPANTRSARLT